MLCDLNFPWWHFYPTGTMELSTSRAKFSCAEDKNGLASIPQTLSIQVSNLTIYGENCQAQYFRQTAQNVAKSFLLAGSKKKNIL